MYTSLFIDPLGLLAQLVISLAAYIFLAPILLLLFLVNEVIRLVITLYLENKYNGKIKLVSDGASATWALKRKDRSRMVVVVMKMDRTVPLEKISKSIEESVFQARNEKGELTYSVLKNILVSKFGYACWKQDENFKVKNQIRSLSPRKVYTKKEILQEIALLSRDMDEDKPQWEIISVPKFKDTMESETSLILFRFQHAFMDGFSLLMIIKNYLSSGFDYYVHPQEFSIPFWKKVLFYTNAIIFGPYLFLKINVRKFLSFWPELREVGPLQKSYTWTKSMDLGAIRKLRKSLHSATIPTILENAFITAAKEVLPPERVPDEWVVGELAALLPYPTTAPQNRFTIFMYGVNSLQPDFERIKTAKEESWKAITGPWIPLLLGMFKGFGRFPMLMHHLLYMGGCCSMILSNVPLSKTKFKFLDFAEVLEAIGFTPLPNDVGISLCSTAYENTLKISANADSTWLKGDELEEIIERIPKVLNGWAQRLELDGSINYVHNNN
ncbi:unnamed protein product [Orchesella dallaii]|uniref:Diacylglycerol O-acyltransferase n=1 Tax=Orchesella dallaii TaxID=48710 RepID=A0ABP1RFI8_9HEXA